MQNMRGKLVATLVCVLIIGGAASSTDAYYEGGYYSQATYYSQGSYYSQGAYVPGSGTLSITYPPGTHSFTVPTYTSLNVKVWGAGGGGSPQGVFSDNVFGFDAVAGGQSRWNNAVIANGGEGGPGDFGHRLQAFGGTASGGTTNLTGDAGGALYYGGGGSSPNGGGSVPSPGGYFNYGTPGQVPGGGGSGSSGYHNGAGGAGGGYSTKAYNMGDLTIGSVIPVVVGAGGSGSYINDPYYTTYRSGGDGAPGRVTVTWESPGSISCFVTVEVNPLEYGNSTNLHWSSANATTMYITNIGYVTPNTSGSVSVGPLSTTAYNGTATGAGGTTNCNVTLAVNVPTAPICSISVTPTSLYEGQSATLSWQSSNTTSCTGTNFSTGGATSGSISVSPSSSTTYTASCTGAGGTVQCTRDGGEDEEEEEGEEGAGVEVLAQCTPATTYSCAGQTIQETQTSMYCENTVTDIETCEAPNFCTNGSASCLQQVMSGSISAAPRLLALGKTATISWSAEHADSCTVTGNGNTWEGTTGSKTSNPITMFATYTLQCTNGVETKDVDSVTIMRLPDWRER